MTNRIVAGIRSPLKLKYERIVNVFGRVIVLSEFAIRFSPAPFSRKLPQCAAAKIFRDRKPAALLARNIFPAPDPARGFPFLK